MLILAMYFNNNQISDPQQSPGLLKSANLFLFIMDDEYFHQAFRGGLLRYYSSKSPAWRPLLESQYVRSLEYWSFRNSLIVVTDRVNYFDTLAVKPLSNTFFLNQYLFEKRYTSLSAKSQTYRTMFLFLIKTLLIP